MSLFSNNLKDTNRVQRQVLVIHPIAKHELASQHYEDGLPIVNYIIKMFKSESSSVRPRRINKSHWVEPLNQLKLFEEHSIFPTRDFDKKVNKPSLPSVENKSNISGHKTVMRNIYDNLEDYFSNSTLHGLRYVGDRSISFGERLFWLFSCVGALCFAVYFITSLYAKYNENPVIMSLNPTPTPLGSLPFPGVTICSMNQAKATEARLILNSGTDVEKMLLADYCKFESSVVNSSSDSEEAATKWENMQDFILRVNPSCQEMLKVCLWKQDEVSCEAIFNSGLTDDGLCCTFNALPRPYIFRKPREMPNFNMTYPPDVDDWNPERGYAKNATADTLPWRAAGEGITKGLTVVLDAQPKSYYCSSAMSIGFKILLHNPLETPKMADFALLMPPGLEARIVIVPKIFDATMSLRDIDIRKRNCYFANERELQFYRTYTERNCKLECQANYTLSMCGCVPYYLPKNRFKKICSKREEACTNVAKDVMEMPSQNGSSCGCLPACFELGFESTSTYGKLSNMFKVREQIIRNESTAYFMDNMAVLHFYFIDTQFTRYTKSELYGFSEFLSNTGGLLGLFMGFSFLSAVEIAYYLTLRILCTVIRNRQQNQKNKTISKSNKTALNTFSR